MHFGFRTASLLASIAGTLFVLTSVAEAQSRVIIRPNAAKTFATLPADADFPEGIAVDPDSGDVFVGTLDVNPAGPTNFLVRFGANGAVEVQLPVGLAPIAGLAFNERDQMVYFVRLGNLVGGVPSIQRVPKDFTVMTAVETVAVIPEIGAPEPTQVVALDGSVSTITFGDAFPLPLGIAFRPSDGALFATDALQAAIFQIADPTQVGNTCPADASCVTLVKQDPAFASTGFPGLGANDLAFGDDENTLFVTNTGQDALLALDLTTLGIRPIAQSLEGVDGIVNGPNGTLVTSFALADEIAILDEATGRILAEIGEFRGIRRDGSVRGLLFPGSITLNGDEIFASNLALVQTGSPAEPEGDVTTYTVARLRIPRSVTH